MCERRYDGGTALAEGLSPALDRSGGQVQRRNRLLEASEDIMDEITKLAEQHIRESESHLRHIDELMERARQAQAQIAAAEGLEERLTQIRRDRDRLASELDDMRKQPVDDWPKLAKRGEGLKGVLQAVGIQLEKILAAVFQ